MCIAVDLMGSGHPPSLLLPAIKNAVGIFDEGEAMLLVATPDIVEELQGHLQSYSKISYLEAENAVGMDDEPLQVVRRKKNSSMGLAIKSLQEGRANAVVTMGNTGALMAYATLTLPKLPKIERPALLAKIPTERGHLYLLDVGANMRSSKDLLIQNAILGAVYAQVSNDKISPKLGLLNVGEEAIKGKGELREAYEKLKGLEQHFDFVGNIEGHEIFSSEIDILVTDGFTGNILLKTAEGLSAYIFKKLQEEGELSSGIQDLKRKLHYAEAPGALLCGLEGIVIKCHGDRDPQGLYNGIIGARDAIRAGLIPQMKATLASI